MSSNLSYAHLKPGLRVVAGVQGDDAASIQISLALAEYILSHAELDDGIGKIMDRSVYSLATNGWPNDWSV